MTDVGEALKMYKEDSKACIRIINALRIDGTIGTSFEIVVWYSIVGWVLLTPWMLVEVWNSGIPSPNITEWISVAYLGLISTVLTRL